VLAQPIGALRRGEQQKGLTLLGDAADDPSMGSMRGEQRLLWLLWYLGPWGFGDTSTAGSRALERDLALADPWPVPEDLFHCRGWEAYAPVPSRRPVARVVWREGVTEHQRVCWSLPDAEGLAVELRVSGCEDVSVERLDDEDGRPT
jgi:hypothetical protein